MSRTPDSETELTRRDTPAGNSWRAVLGLAAIAVIAGTIVGLTWESTRERVAANAAQRSLAEFSAILPADLYDNEPQTDVVWLDPGAGEPLPVYRARRHGEPVAAVLTTIAPDGYVGPIHLLVSLAVDGRILGVRITSHTETPGIGAAIDARNSGWTGTFTGRSLTDPPELRWSLRQDGGDIDGISGATISSRAVVAATRRAMQYFATHREEIFSAPAVPPDAASPNRVTR